MTSYLPEQYVLSAETAAKLRRIIDAQRGPTSGNPLRAPTQQMAVCRSTGFSDYVTDSFGTQLKVYYGFIELLLDPTNGSWQEQNAPCFIAEMAKGIGQAGSAGYSFCLDTDKLYMGLRVGDFTGHDGEARPLFIHTTERQTAIGICQGATARDGTTAGSGLVNLVYLPDMDPTLTDGGESIFAFNLTKCKIPSGVYVEVVRENVSGDYFIVWYPVKCGLKYDADGNINVRIEDDNDGSGIAGDGLTIQPSQTGDCDKAKAFLGCGLTFDFSMQDNVGNSAIKVDNTALAGCGIKPSVSFGSCAVDVDNTALAGCGIKPSVSFGPCAVDVDNLALAGCGLTAGEGCQIHFAPEEIAGCGLVGNDDTCELAVDNTQLVGCGIKVGPSGCSLQIDRDTLFSPGSSGMTSDGTDCGSKINCGCGVEINGGELQIKRDDLCGCGIAPGDGTCDLQVDNLAVAGKGLIPASAGCAVDLRIGCGLEFAGTPELVQVKNDDLAGCGLVPDAMSCQLHVAASELAGCGLVAHDGGSTYTGCAIDVDMNVDHSKTITQILVSGTSFSISGGCLEATVETVQNVYHFNSCGVCIGVVITPNETVTTCICVQSPSG